jgi:UDP-N-acetyl-D-glucosamine/UDP-N-acetyl-D-galactosamine dehydrogenase
MDIETFAQRLVPGGVFADVKSSYDPAAIQRAGLQLWRL